MYIKMFVPSCANAGGFVRWLKRFRDGNQPGGEVLKPEGVKDKFGSKDT